MSLAPVGSAPALLDGARWPRCRDLGAEFPSLTDTINPPPGRSSRARYPSLGTR
ncbi:DUF5994 family protein [Streptomyces sp. 142MFCol3.1]|uniref:DUF5994 family protein n=1 Tax=Streptomyces sp. 142MFCol3.1 TaxID=1172179 RepID=UPI002D21B86A|nr:DUF5994 family protein [Streptomyces sp. 142MFCol3.1]